MSDPTKTGIEQKESAVKEERHWVRLTRVCNNRCLFCLDSRSLNPALTIPHEEIVAEIERGRERGAQRLILSGGEPTIHPEFVDYIKLGGELGYTWIQTISNGRMFAYPRFVKQVIRAGLREATFSVHGHTAELHDRLVGIPGAFEQVMRGVRNVKRVRGFVLSIDVVLNRQNVPHLEEMLRFFISLGVREFDLLHLVPFGRAWEGEREALYYDRTEMVHHLKRAFDIRREEDVVIWTNRLPPEHLEGDEDLIQDPHKLHDEVRGRMRMFRALLDEGTAFECKGERCPHCPLERFCGRLDDLLAFWDDGGARRVRIRPDAPATLVEEARRRLGDGVERVLEIDDEHALPADLSAYAAIEYLGQDDARLAALAGSGLPTTFTLRRGWPAPDRVPEGARARFPAFEFASEVALSSPRVDARVRELAPDDLPRCVGGSGETPWRDTFPLSIVDAETLRVDPVRYTDHYIRHRYRVKSLRCDGCREVARCAGLHINHVRAWGFEVLRPMD
jgi:MoaA/NifB/PqqE/SkfB family radical SAM enzyme